MYFFPHVTLFLQPIKRDLMLEARNSPAFSNSASTWHTEAAENGTRSVPWWTKCTLANLAHLDLVGLWASEDFRSGLVAYTQITSYSCLQELLGTSQIYCWLWPAAYSLSSPQRFWTGPLGPNPISTCTQANKLSSLLSSRSRLMSLVVAATLIRLRSGFRSHFGPGRVVKETSLSSLTWPDCCHLVLPGLWAWCCSSSGLLSPERCLQSLSSVSLIFIS